MTADAGDDAAKRYRAFVLGALLLVFSFNFIDRTLVAVLNEQIKREFNATDALMGLLGGPAFALLYTFLGIPMGRLAERFNRVAIIAAALAIWSILTALCGLAGKLNSGLHIAIYLLVLAPAAVVFLVHRMWTSAALVLAAVAASALMPAHFAGLGLAAFGLLLMTRIGVGIGEAGCSPPSHALIADYFPPHRRASALAIYALGIPIGTMISAIGGGWLAQNVDWRAAFLWLGLPGVAVAIFVMATVREPKRTSEPAAAPPDFSAALSTLTRKWTFWSVSLGGAATAFVGYGVGQFLNSFLIRTHGLKPFDASLIFGLVLGLAAAIGTFLGGFLADRLSKRLAAAHAWVPGVALIIAAPLYALGLQATSLPLMAAALSLAAACQYTWLGPTFGVTQGLVPPQMRATASALLLFVVNAIGFGFGPPLIGALSDALAAHTYAQSVGGDYASACTDLAAGVAECAQARARGLQTALTIGVCGYAVAGLLYLLSIPTMRRDIVS